MARLGRGTPFKPGHPFIASEWYELFVPRTIANAGAAEGVGRAYSLPEGGGHARADANANAAAPAASMSVATAAATGAAKQTSSIVTARAGVATALGAAFAPAITTPNSVPLGRARAALQAAGTTPCNILVIGDSLSEGYSDDEGQIGFIDQRYGTKLAALLRTRYLGASGGVGFVNNFSSAVNGSSGGSAYWTFSGSSGTNGESGDQHAFGNRSAGNTGSPPGAAVNEVVTFHFVGTSCKFQFVVGSSPVTIAVDGGTPDSFSPPGGTRTYQTSYSTPTFSHGSHTVVITPTTGAVADVRGAYVFDGDESSGIYWWEHALSGVNSVGALLGEGSAAGLVDPTSSGFCHNPALVIIELGVNDFRGSQISNHPTASEYQTNLTSIVANVKAACSTTPSIVLLASYEFNLGATTITHPWADYVTAMKSVATADSTNISVIDFSALMAKPTSGNSYDGGLVGPTSSHLTWAGHTYWAQQLDSFIASS